MKNELETQTFDAFVCSVALHWISQIKNKGSPPALLLLVLASSQRQVALLNLLLQELVDGEGDGLAGSDTHDTGGDALVEGVESFLPVGVEVSTGRPQKRTGMLLT